MEDAPLGSVLSPPVEKSLWSKIWPWSLALVIGIAFLLSQLVPNYLRSANRGSHVACKSNLKNLATALEMYATDHQGDYPPTLDSLYPKYFRNPAGCPATDKLGYFYTTSGKGPKSRFHLTCPGQHRNYGPFEMNPRAKAGYPQYSSTDGLIE